ncbi:MAG TPA: PspA/IM30 family protein [Aggregatilineales bacterium]|nr:PspA/IM30 family protein [Aggregatilineales bacterium]
MDDLFKKLNTLIRSNLNDVTPNIHLPKRSRPIDLDRQVDELRKRINAALEHEDHLQATVRKLRNEAERLDEAADDALARGHDDDARRLLEQLKRTEQRLAMAESDLREHQIAVEDLIRRVNELDATIADTRAAQQPPPAPSSSNNEPRRVRIPLSDDQGDNSVILKRPAPESTEDAPSPSKLAKISDMIREAQERTRERIDEMDSIIRSRQETAPPPVSEQPAEAAPQPASSAEKPKTAPDKPASSGKEDDLQRRIDRLSKR